MISPLEIRQQQFAKALRGYDAEEVKAFLASLSQEWERMQDDNKRLRSEVDKLHTSLQRYQEVESILHKTLKQAEDSSRGVVENAQREADLKLRSAEQEAAHLLLQAKEERTHLEREVRELQQRRDDLILNMEQFLRLQLDRLYQFRAQTPTGSAPSENHSPQRMDPSFFQQLLGETDTRGTEIATDIARPTP